MSGETGGDRVSGGQVWVAGGGVVCVCVGGGGRTMHMLLSHYQTDSAVRRETA